MSNKKSPNKGRKFSFQTPIKTHLYISFLEFRVLNKQTSERFILPSRNKQADLALLITILITPNIHNFRN